MRRPMLFDNTHDRRPRRVLMRVVDAGEGCGCPDDSPGPHVVRFGCNRCGHETGWLRVDSVAEAKRGIPCPKCNPPDAGGATP